MQLDTPSKQGYLKVSTIHQIYFELIGAENVIPILFVHGGPGIGFSDLSKRFFDFTKHCVLFFDQRGASKSKPFGSIEENTTQDLVNDITKLLVHLNIEKIHLFGGSWGTTLSLIYAIQHPERVETLLLRGLFLGDKKSSDYYLTGGVAKISPKAWLRFKQNVPQNSPKTIPEYYFDKMINGTPEEKQFFCYEWSYYEISIFKIDITDSEIKSILQQVPYKSLAILEAHYLINNCFIEEDYIVNHTEKLKNIPITCIHGINDTICPVDFAIEFDSTLENSKLFLEKAGHSDSEPLIEKRIKNILSSEIYTKN